MYHSADESIQFVYQEIAKYGPSLPREGIKLEEVEISVTVQ